MDIKTRSKIMKFCGILLIVCAFIGFFFVMYSNEARPKDTLITILFGVLGGYFTWLGYNPDKLNPRKK